MAITATQQTTILKIVSGLFNAAPGATYLTGFANYIAGGGTMLGLANALAADAAFTTGIMGGQVTVTAQVAKLMTNFGLTPAASWTAADVAGTANFDANAYFTAAINAGTGFGQIVHDAVTYLELVSAGTIVAPQYAATATTLVNKAAVAEYYSATLGTASTTLATLQSVVSGVTSTTPVATAVDLQSYLATVGAVPSATYNLANAAAVNEGGNAIFALTTTNVLNGTTVNYTISGTGIAAADVAGGALTGTAQVINNVATITVGTLADLTTEGAETLTVSIAGTNATATGVVNDTSLTPTYTLTAAAASSNEGAANTFTVNSSYAADGSTLSYTLAGTGVAAADVTGGLTGTVTLVNGVGTITVNAAADATTEGAEAYTVTVVDGAGTTVATSAASIADTSITPVLATDTIQVIPGAAGTVAALVTTASLLANDTDSTGAALTGAVTVVAGSEVGGTTVLNAAGDILFSPNAGVTSGSFQYAVAGVTQTGTANIIFNTTPVATAGTGAVTEGTQFAGAVAGTDADVGQTLTYTLVTGPTKGTLGAINATTGAFTYDYTGAAGAVAGALAVGVTDTDTFTFIATDSMGKASTAQTVTLTTTGINDTPALVAPAPAAIAANSGQAGITVDLSTYATDPDAAAGTLTYALTGATTTLGGAVTIAGTTATINYAQGGGAAALGADSFGFTVTDGVIVTPISATVNLNVTNTAPTAGALALTAKTGVAQTIDLAAGTTVASGVTSTFVSPVVDAQGNTLTPVIAVGSVSAGGSAEVINGQIVYTSTVGYVGTETVTYTVTDGFGGTSAPATITFTVASNTGGTSGADLLYGSTAAENIDGLAGNDTIVGGGGLDTVTGGIGDDRVTFSDGAVQILGAAGLDTLVVNADAVASAFDLSSTTQQNIDTNSLNANSARVVVRTFENVDAALSSGNFALNSATTLGAYNAALGGDAATTMSVLSGAGDDGISFSRATGTGVVVQTNDGNDTIFVNNDGTADTASGTFSIDGGAGNDTINVLSTTAVHTLIGGAGNDTITLGTGASAVDAGDGNDTITSSATDMSLVGGAGNDTFSFLTANLTTGDTISGGTGTDTLSLADASTVVDADFTSVTSVEVLTESAANANQTITLGALAMAAGLNTITGNGTGVDVVTVGAGFTSALTVNLATGADNVTATASAAALTVSAAAASITTADTLTGGTSTGDVLSITADDSGVGAVFGTSATAFETITIVAGSTAGFDAMVTTADGNLAATNTLTINASALTDAAAVFTFVGGDESDGNYVITGGAGNDVITGAINTTSGANSIDGGAGNDVITAGAGADSLAGGTGNDTFSFLSANLTSADTISGGTGTDTLSVSDASTVVDADFTLATSVEVLTEGTGNANQTITLGALAMAAGLNTITGNGTGVDVVTVGAGFTSALTVNLGAGNDNVTAAASAAALTVSAADASIDANDTLTGGTSAGDVLSITAASGATTLGANVTGFETITVVAATTNTVQITTNNANLAAANTLTINASALTNAAATFTFAGGAESDGNYVITGGAGNDVITGAINTTSGANSIDGGAGNDVITAGAGADSLAGGTGNDSFSFLSANLTSADTISGGTGTDTLSVSDASTVVDADFTNVTSVEVLTEGTGNANQTITLGALAMAAGLNTITGNGSGVDAVTVGAGFTSALTVNVGTGNDNVTAAASAAALTVALTETALDGSDTLVGGTSTGDIITLTADGSSATLGANFSGFETINIANNVATSITTNNANIASAGTLRINAAALTSTALTLVGGAELDGAFNVTGGTIGDTITTGSGADTVDGGAGADNITGGAGVDSLTGGAGDDTISGGTGIDVMDGGAGNDTITIDNVAEAVTESSGTSDTLIVSHTGVGGAIIVDLSSATDQITLWNGLTNAAVQLGFENVDVSAYSNSAGADITAAAGGSTITGTTQTDVVTLGAGADIVKFTTATVTGVDSITSFTAGATVGDTLDFSAIANLVKTYEAIATDTADITTDANVIVINAATAIATAATLIAADTTVTGTSGYIVILDTANSNALTVYHSTNLAANGTETALVTLTGVTITNLVTGNFDVTV